MDHGGATLVKYTVPTPAIGSADSYEVMTIDFSADFGIRLSKCFTCLRSTKLRMLNFCIASYMARKRDKQPPKTKNISAPQNLERE